MPESHADPVPARRPPRGRPLHTLLTDLDHTLFDWTRGWAEAMAGLLQVLRGEHLNDAAALEGLRASYVRHHTMDAAAALDEAAAVWRRPPTPAALRRAAAAYRAGWQRALTPLAGVESALARLRRGGARVIGFTESPPAATAARLALVGLTDAFDWVVCTSAEVGCRTPAVGLACGRAPRGSRIEPASTLVKGTTQAVADLIESQRLEPEGLGVIGDQPDKDLAPAIGLGLVAFWARYGTRRAPRDYALLLRACHWPVDVSPGHQPAAQDIARAARRRAVDRFDAILSAVEWTRAPAARAAW